MVGTRGRAPVSGPQLEGIFGLPSGPTAVTTVTSAPGASPSAARRLLAPGSLAAAETAFEVLEIHGRVFPARHRSDVAIQLQTPHGWRTVTHAQAASGGFYEGWLALPGTYRALYGHVSGPAVAVH